MTVNVLQNKGARRPVIDPLLLALKSRRVLIALSAFIVGVLVIAVPELEAVQGELMTLLITLSLALIGGYTIEDAATAGRNRSQTPLPAELEALVRMILLELLSNEQLPVEEGDTDEQ